MKYSIFLIFLIGIGCNQYTTQESASISTISITHFKNIPEDVDGCACYFSGSRKQFDSSEFLFAAGMDSLGYISINDEILPIHLVKTNREQDVFFDEGKHIDVYEADGYTITIDYQYTKKIGDESNWYKGILKVEDNNRNISKSEFVGECGC